VFQDQQYTSEGTTTSEEESLWVWNAKLTGEESTVPMPQVAPQNAEAIKQLVDVMRRAFGSNFYPALLSLGYAAAGVHYQTILKQEGAFPTLNLFGDPGFRQDFGSRMRPLTGRDAPRRHDVRHLPQCCL
jgi:hypothetical protein